MKIELATPRQIVGLLTDAIIQPEVEQFIAICADKDWECLGCPLIAVGNEIGCKFHLDDIFKGVSAYPGTKYLVVGHNHTRYDLTPSPEDYKLTEVLGMQPWSKEGIIIEEHYAFLPQTGAYNRLMETFYSLGLWDGGEEFDLLREN